MRTLLVVLLSAATVSAGENAYDVIGKVITPLAQVLAESPKTNNRAVKIAFSFQGEKEAPGERVSLMLEMPDKLRVTAPFEGETITVCRRGQVVWAYPGSRVQALLAEPAVAARLPSPDRKIKLAPFHLPLPEKQIAFLPVLFQVKEAGEAVIGGETCRGLQLRPAAELLKSARNESGSRGTIWVAPGSRLARLALEREQGSVTFDFESIQYGRKLTPETWQPSAAESADVYTLDPVVYDQIFRALLRLK